VKQKIRKRAIQFT